MSDTTIDVNIRMVLATILAIILIGIGTYFAKNEHYIFGGLLIFPGILIWLIAAFGGQKRT